MNASGLAVCKIAKEKFREKNVFFVEWSTHYTASQFGCIETQRGIESNSSLDKEGFNYKINL